MQTDESKKEGIHLKKLQDFPRVALGLFPTPIHALENVSRRFGANVYLKRDDLTGLGLGGKNGN